MPTDTPNPDPKEEKAEPTPEEKSAARIKELNDESARHRREAKEAKRLAETLEKQVKAIHEMLGVDEEHDLETKLSEFRAAAEKGTKTGSEVVQLQQRVEALSKENKKLKGDYELTAKEKEEISGLFASTTISHELRKSFSDYEDLAGPQQDLLETFLKSQGYLKLNDKRKPVWVVRDEDGDELDSVPIKQGLASFFEKNPGYLPSQTAKGADTKESAKATPSRVNRDAAGMFGVRNEDGVKIVDRAKYAEDRKHFIR